MKAVFPLLITMLIVGSCKKNRDDTGSGARCLETTILQTNIANNLEAVFFLNGKDGFVADNAGGIYKTTDSAKTWRPLNSTVNLPVYDLYFTDAQKGYAVGGWSFCNGTGCTPPGGFILRTLDGGQTWTRVHTPSEKIEIHSIHFVNPSLGFCAGGNTILKTTDGGQTWSEYKVNNPGGFIMEIRFVNAQEGYAASHFSQVLRTLDGGQSWEVLPHGYNNGYYALAASTGTLYLSGQGKMLKSTNKGGSWTELANSPVDIFDLHFVDAKRGFAFGRGNWSGGDFGSSYGAVYCTDNGGETWRGTSEVKETGLIKKASFPANNLGYAISGNKLIRFTDK